MQPVLVVSGDFVTTGGMDRANYALADYLDMQGTETHLVAHRVDEKLSARRNIVVHRVPKLGHSYMLAEPLLDWTGRLWAKRLHPRGVRVVVNGGNCLWGDVNWVHYVHAAYAASSVRKTDAIKRKAQLRLWQWRESSTLRRARIVIVNSQRTKDDLIERIGVSNDVIRSIYYGIDEQLFQPATENEKKVAREALGWPAGCPVVMFVGALGDRRKGFDTVFNAWRELCAMSAWDAMLMVVGSGEELPKWKERAKSAGLLSHITFLGKRWDVPTLLKAADALVAPSRYEAYGLAVHEALCCGIPALVTASAGVAERYPASMNELLIRDPDDIGEVARRIAAWRTRVDFYRCNVANLASQLRQYNWDHMAARIVALLEATV